MARVPNGPVRDLYLAAVARGVSPNAICRRVGMMRTSKPTCCDADRLRRCLGVTPTRARGRLLLLRTIDAGLAGRLEVAIGELTAHVCGGCGEVLVEPGLCGWCVEERSGVAA
jgi:hypothetical protein